MGKPQIALDIEVNEPILAGLPATIKINISNKGNAIFFSGNLKVENGKLNILGNSKNLGSIPAFGNVSYQFNIRTKSIFDQYEDEINILIGSQKFTKRVKVSPFFLLNNIPVFLVGAVILMVIIYGGVLGVLIYRRRFIKR